jgi:glycosyltransferase involved in cell wall biosynthesis
MKLHFIQDEATPHNNLLIKELTESPDIQLLLWYSREKSMQYSWKQDPTHECKKANIYGDHKINWQLLFYLLRFRNERVFQVGWANPTTKMIVLLFFLTRRPYNMWSDYPNDKKKRSILNKYLREMFYLILKYSKANVFCVGKITVDYFVERGYSNRVLFNLPIPVDTSKSKYDYLQQGNLIHEKYHVKKGDIFLVAGSRLTYEKGYDLLVKALSMLDKGMKQQVKVLIIGEGNEKKTLLQKIQDAGLDGIVFIEGWMGVEEYRAHIANADVFVHPARYDAYGGSIFAMALGIPVLGSSGAGAVIDNIESGENGLIFQKNNVDELNLWIRDIIDNKIDLISIGKKMLQKIAEQNEKSVCRKKLIANLLA